MATKEQRKIAYSKLSEEARDFASSQEVIDIIGSLCKKHSLSPEKQDTLDTLVYETLIDIYPINDFSSKLKSSLIVPSQTMNSISTEIQEKIFKPFLATKNGSGKPTLETQIKDTSALKLFLEDQKGNSDNLSPIIPPERLPREAPSLDIIKNEPSSTTSFQKTLSSQTPNTVAPTTENVIIKKQYSGQDPYREPPKP